MVFVVLIPGIPRRMGNFVLPIMLGAKDVAFPRLNLWSYYFFVGGVLVLLLDPRCGGGRHRLDVLHALQRADLDARDLRRCSAPSCWASARSSPA